MFTVALIGPDGAGKTTICRRIEQELPLPAKYVYMGINPESSNYLLPTTRLRLEFLRTRGRSPGGPGSSGLKSHPTGGAGRSAAAVRAALRLANQLGEEWFRQAVVCYHLHLGRIVLFDRHFFFDYYASVIAPSGTPRRLSDRIHAYVLDRLYPRPDLVIMLDAPAGLLFTRKPEGTVELLERKRQEYRHLPRLVEHFHTVDATQTAAEVTRQVTDLIISHYETSAGGPHRSH